MNPESKNFSKFESVLVISEYILKPKIDQKPKRTTQPKKPNDLENDEKIKSVVCTGTNISMLLVLEKFSPKKPPKDICKRLCC